MPKTSLTEEQVELHVEKRQDALDAAWISGNLSQEEYNAGCKAIDDWAKRKLA